MNTLKYIFLLWLLPVSSVIAAQNDTIFSPHFRLGVDISGLARYYFEPEIIQGEISLDYEWKNDWFVAAEAGFIQMDVQRASHAYLANGFFFRLGPDYNVLKKENQANIGQIVLSARYGYGLLSQQAPEISIHMPGWDPLQTHVDAENFHAHWLEFGGGIKTRLWKNVFLGWNVRTRFLVSQTKSPGMDPYMISGYGKNDGKTAVMVHYYIYYRF